MKPTRVLHIIDGMGSGGAEAFIMNLYRNIDRNKVQFDFLLRYDEDMHFKEIKDLGGRIFMTAPFPSQPWQNYQDTKNFFAEHNDYDIIHVHANALIYMTALSLAKKAGIRCRVMHSHNTQARKPLYRLIHETNKLFIDRLSTHQVACSSAAGQWMFNNEDYSVVNNGIDVKKYLFDQTSRDEIRQELNLEGKFVVGHIGRFLRSKNHLFLLDIFSEIYKQNKDAVLLLIGTGLLEKEIKQKVQELGLEEVVIFAGVRNDIEKVFQAMDVFLFPSLFEGLGIVAVEAQAAGLHTLVSEAVPKEAFLTDRIEQLSLQDSKEKWATKVLGYQHDFDRPNTYEELQTGGYDIKTVAKAMEDYYISLATSEYEVEVNRSR